MYSLLYYTGIHIDKEIRKKDIIWFHLSTNNSFVNNLELLLSKKSKTHKFLYHNFYES